MKASELIDKLTEFKDKFGDLNVQVNNTRNPDVISVAFAQNNFIILDSASVQSLGYEPFADINDMKMWFSAAGLRIDYHHFNCSLPVRFKPYHQIKIWKDTELFGMWRFDNIDEMLKEMWLAFKEIVGTSVETEKTLIEKAPK